MGNDPLNFPLLQQTVETFNQVLLVLIRQAQACMDAIMRQLLLPKKQLN
jgi:hypothetical protein